MGSTIEQVLKQGVLAHREGKLQEAERHYAEVLKSHSMHPDANHNMGALYVIAGKFEEALPYFKKAISSNNKQEQYWVSLINALIKLGMIKDARHVLTNALDLNINGDKIKSLFHILHPSTKLDFFYKYLESLGIFTSQQNELKDGESKVKPLLTSSFLDWFETQKWNKLKLLELGSGNSTLYFSKFFESITSYETDQSWFDKLIIKKLTNVNLIKVDSIIKNFEDNNLKNLDNFDVILLDAGENRAKLTRWIINHNYKGIIFFDNSEWYRKSINMFHKIGFLEIPFFGIKPTEDWVSCTSIVADPSRLKDILNTNWLALPKLTHKNTNNLWDDE